MEKGCLAYLAHIRDTSADTLSIDSIPVLREFADVFLADLPDSFMIVFIDDILVYSRSKEEHKKHLRIALGVLRDKNLYAKFSKCEFWLSSMSFLGHVILKEVIMVDPQKIQIVREWARSTSVTEICSLVGMARKISLQHVFTQKNLNSRQLRWMELLKDYDITILYHLGKANMVADALSRKSARMGSLARLISLERPLAREVQTLANIFMRLDISNPGRVLACVMARSSFLEHIKAKQFEDAKLCKIRDKVLRGEAKEAVIDEEGLLWIKGRVCVLRVGDLNKTILAEAHSSRYSIHPGATKMYQDLRQHYWWARI
ncbi:uncharacterized protein LOC132631202 [Lycium barbarum]|uniref:uncharacterized protein LOC132631202 n=1 Tax=Lycium barbarum TaxID=112863 RepID=UPI00293F02E6|nr:uncharacterized protein LOC132631202 [Lycium barbarum]